MKSFLQSINTLQPQLFTIIITTIIIVSCAIVYNVKLKKIKPNEAPTGYVLLINNFVDNIEKTTVEVMGLKFRWLTPYFLYLILYLSIGNLLSLVGFEGIASNYTVVLSLGIVTFVSIYVVGIKFQKFHFFKKFLHNPLDLITQVSPLISITFRIFGNLTAGATIMALFYALTSNAAIKTGWDVANYHINNAAHKQDPSSDFFMFNILGGILSPPLHFYFDIFDGLIQSYVFTLLTMSYVGQEAEVPENKKKAAKQKLRAGAGSYERYVNENIDLVRE